ncbi:complement resistance protein TraT [Escherichia coli]|uniref:complement resistance protein TraT n=1 Tax=Escherichia coli TaxID=562 RepID=UPI000E1D09D8|nr:complement resistance protein TraT [Escherichia coli]
MTDLGGKTSIFSHPVYLFLREFSLQDFRGGSVSSANQVNLKFEEAKPHLEDQLAKSIANIL